MPSTPNSLTAEHLTTIRRQTDWRRLFTALEIERDEHKSRDDDWWGHSPFRPDERTASFHLNDRGWYCHATAQGGGVLELVQALHPELTCYDAACWLLDQGLTSITASIRADIATVLPSRPRVEPVPEENPPIRQDLRPALCLQHDEFRRRGIPEAVLRELGAGYLERPPRKNGRADPMNRRLVFQIRSLVGNDAGDFESAIVGHMGRATSAEQAARDGKWWTYTGFRKSLELYNLDRAILQPAALAQARMSGHVLLVEGCFDVAKLVAAGIENVVATLGAHLSAAQVERCALLAQATGVERFLVWYDRDQDGSSPESLGMHQAVEALIEHGFETEVFDWSRSFPSSRRGVVPLPATLKDPCDFSVERLQWLREKGLI